ncbi:DNA polymerase-3 subunit epsilon [Pullulanibacillus pueri]|uniref:Exonuclease domain-containing protein n=1 Tax=Pullulanibacillus pueri TaxID=1437324 RepID=A0A8J2ZU21_9BACL|nr:exonuclease domain-containing protein [Pullulanibacillus pueri]MBM7680777.1 DNA polymerase-3 subunit epsilon [Pullulanibacillus pueri]GGH78291.1 hypothetical protein GCM10007096_11490 [Pullulanibacillus pueri]
MNDKQRQSWFGKLLTPAVPSNQSGTFQNEAFIRSLLKDAKRKRHDLQSQITQIPITLLDTETTGFHPEAGDQMISIALAKTQNGEILEDYYSLINPRRSIPENIRALTQIKEEDVESAPPLNEVIDHLLSLLSGTIIIGYHIQHDISFFNHFLWQNGRLKLTQQSLELRQIAEVLNSQPFPSLDDALDFYNVSCGQRHSAKGDVEAMLQLWRHLLDDMKQEKIITLMDLYARLA